MAVLVAAPLEGIQRVQNDEVERFGQAEKGFLSCFRVDLQPPAGIDNVEAVEVLILDLREERDRVCQPVLEAPLRAFRKDVQDLEWMRGGEPEEAPSPGGG